MLCLCIIETTRKFRSASLLSVGVVNVRITLFGAHCLVWTETEECLVAKLITIVLLSPPGRRFLTNLLSCTLISVDYDWQSIVRNFKTTILA